MKKLEQRYLVVDHVPTKGEAAEKVRENFGIKKYGTISSIVLLRPIKPENI